MKIANSNSEWLLPTYVSTYLLLYCPASDPNTSNVSFFLFYNPTGSFAVRRSANFILFRSFVRRIWKIQSKDRISREALLLLSASFFFVNYANSSMKMLRVKSNQPVFFSFFLSSAEFRENMKGPGGNELDNFQLRSSTKV